PAPSAACAAAPTPADREICGDPQLRRLQRELQRAYVQALDAHQDRALLRQRQLAWRDARNAVADPARLARLYQDRIRKLNAAAADARGER
ncbi:MAG: lysozyme inhibitor LprI family protein, partial [Caulobacterales bacterium]